MKKIFAILAVFTALIFAVSCGGGSNSGNNQNDNSDTGDTEIDDDGGSNTGSKDDTAQVKEGIYLGIIGFNQNQYTKDIGLLNNSTAGSYKIFIDNLTSGDGTGLYFADYTALGKMREFPVPPKLKKVALVTFTDGLDNISLANDDYNPENFGSTADYRNALHNMIVKEKIHGLNVEAYTIGLKGKDVTDDAAFEETLKNLASNDSNVFQVSDMNEAMEHFREIAGNLYSVSKTVNLKVKVPGGYDDGQKLRFTFDNPVTATDSNLYIEATFRRSNGRTLEEISYNGLAVSQPFIPSESSEGAYYYFVFEDLKYAGNNTPLSENDIRRLMLWKATSTGGWDRESEFNPESSSVITEDKSSAIIMLVLDCTTSLGNDFSRMKQAGKDFVTTLVNGGSGLTENDQTTPCDPNPCTTLPNSTGVCAESGQSYICECYSDYNWNGYACTSDSSSTSTCSNGFLDEGEACDGGTKECNEIDPYYTSGYATCKADCSCWDTFSCSSATINYSGGCATVDGNIWSSLSSSALTWQEALNYCDNLNECGYSDWRLPNINELRTLIKNCPRTQTGGDCAVSDPDYLSFDGDFNSLVSNCSCPPPNNICGYFSKLSDDGHVFFSSSIQSNDTDRAWGVTFMRMSGVTVNPIYKLNNTYVRCVR